MYFCFRKIFFPSGFIHFNPASGVNSKFPDYEPVLTPDESSLLFTSRRDGFGNYQNIEIYSLTSANTGGSGSGTFLNVQLGLYTPGA